MEGRRIPCCNPRCRRTAAYSETMNSDEIVCAKCWKTLPPAQTERYRDLRQRYKRIARSMAKRERNGNLPNFRKSVSIYDHLDALVERNWRDMKASFQQSVKPEGIDKFMEEAGLR